MSKDLNITKMFELYKADNDEKGKVSVSNSMYMQIFNTCFNLSFHKHKTDRYKVCEIHKREDALSTSEAKEIFSEH